MPPKFGTSGLRGLVVALTPELVAAHVQAFLVACPVGTGLYVGRDLRPSSPDIAQMVIDAAVAAGVDVVDCGDVPTPALALAAMNAGAGAVMITGSHIPADRNGLKFYTPAGEITKDDEAGILAALGQVRAGSGAVTQADVGPAYVARYVDAFGGDALKVAGRNGGIALISKPLGGGDGVGGDLVDQPHIQPLFCRHAAPPADHVQRGGHRYQARQPLRAAGPGDDADFCNDERRMGWADFAVGNFHGGSPVIVVVGRGAGKNVGALLAPAAVNPEPLFRVSVNPCLQSGGDFAHHLFGR